MMTSRFSDGGRRISLLGYGAMRLPEKSGEIDQEQLNSQVKLMLDGGINYFDTSPAYCRGRSEAALGKALKASGYARKDYAIATKLSNFASSQFPLEKCRAMFEKSLKLISFISLIVSSESLFSFFNKFIISFCI